MSDTQDISLPEDWMKYPHVEPQRRLDNMGEEFVLRTTYIELKDNGANVSVMFENLIPVVCTHNQRAVPDIVGKIQGSKSWAGILKMLNGEFYQHHLIVYGELLKPAKQNTPWLYHVFDVLDTIKGMFLEVPEILRLSQKYGFETVRLLEVITPSTPSEVDKISQKWEALLKDTKHEGIVVKTYDPSMHKGISLFKWRQYREGDNEPKIRQPKGPQLPSMPPEKIQRCLEHTWDLLAKIIEDEYLATADSPEIRAERLAENFRASPEAIIGLWKRPDFTMPKLVKIFAEEATEHGYAVPRNLYHYYSNTDFKILQGKID